MQNFQIVIISAVRICKQCMQTASASVGLCTVDPLPGLHPRPHWGTLVPRRWTIALPQMKIHGAATAGALRVKASWPRGLAATWAVIMSICLQVELIIQ